MPSKGFPERSVLRLGNADLLLVKFRTTVTNSLSSLDSSDAQFSFPDGHEGVGDQAEGVKAFED